ncbi:uncharacterized protein LOC101456557 isoform X1 [Ceratitis capitata]|uniref:(Mediterranean fruit fly) hypothetical protein n=1 Tax=Ceratitis capitata TaxID=7213 RepID=A0A811UDW8_CERCA|nr:uncharacterized protein LOC101456557 isoform X1 [Ceratitis capitata]CAD6997099.1 unnamed protein product [Ceratitis capitata]
MAEPERRTTSEHFLRTQLDILTAQNTRLQEENNLLRQQIARVAVDSRSAGAINVEAKIAALRLEDERDEMYDRLERLKKKYNKLHGAYLEKVQRCKALEDTFKRQKTLAGLVMKSALNQRSKDLTAKLETENREKQVAKLQAALSEAYDIIDELEFELESTYYLEQEMQRMREELFALKSQQKLTPQSAQSQPQLDDGEPPPSYASDMTDGPSSTARGTSSNVRSTIRLSTAASSSSESLPNDDADSETLERAAMTHSLIENAAAETFQLRRELLKSRLQNTYRPQ